MVISEVVQLYAECISNAVPFAFIVWAGDMLVGIILRAAFGGKLTFRG